MAEVSPREQVLASVRSAAATPSAGGAVAYENISRPYRQTLALSRQELADMFVDRLVDYGAAVYRCEESKLAEQVQTVLRENGRVRVVASPAAVALIPKSSYGELNSADGVVTCCSLAIALTGTIVLKHAPDAEGIRALSLIPDYHLAIVRESQIVGTVTEALEIMSGWANVPLTMYSGPSATADIEMTRIQGVHGPRTAGVILAA